MSGRSKAVLPKRLYYPLPEAAEKLKCTVKDIIHFGAIGVLKISIYINNWIEKEDSVFIVDCQSYDIYPLASASEAAGGIGLLSGEGWYVSGIYNKKLPPDDFLGEATFAKHVTGFFYLDKSTLVDFEFNHDNERIKVTFAYAYENDEAAGYTSLTNLLGVEFPSQYLCVLAEDMENIGKAIGAIHQPQSNSQEMENSKTAATKSAIIPALINMIPEMNSFDLEIEPVATIVNALETVATKKGIEFPDVHRQTWQKYLGR